MAGLFRKGNNAMNDQEFGRLEQKVEQCLTGINGIKDHIEKLYGKDAENGKEIAVLKDNVGLLNKVSWTLGSAVILAFLGALINMVIKK